MLRALLFALALFPGLSSAAVPQTFQTDFLTIPNCVVWTGDFFLSQAKRSQCINDLLARRYTEVYIELTPSELGFYNQPNFYDEPSSTIIGILQEFVNSGINPVVFLTGDEGTWKDQSESAINADLSTLIPQIDPYVYTYALGIESDEYWSLSKTVSVGSHLRTLTTKPIGVHQLPQKWDYCQNQSWCDYLLLQYGFGHTTSEILTITQQAIAALGKPVVAFEYNAPGESEQTSIQLGNAGVSAGAIGFGNGGTASTAGANGSKYEAEAAVLANYVVEPFAAASGGNRIAVQGVAGATGTATFSVTEQTGSYTLYVGYMRETDGTSGYSVTLNGAQIASWTSTASTGGPEFVEQVIADVAITAGSSLMVTGTRTDTTAARLDYIRLVPSNQLPPEPFVGSLTVAWDQSYIDTNASATDVLDYDVQYQRSGSGYSSVRTVVDDNSGAPSTVFTFPGNLQANNLETVCFRVRARNNIGSSELSDQACIVVSNAPVYACNDQIDNDGDGKIDYPSDPGCFSSTDDSELDLANVAAHTVLKFYLRATNDWGYARLYVDDGCVINQPISVFGDEAKFTESGGNALVDDKCDNYALNTNITMDTIDVCKELAPCSRQGIVSGTGECTGVKCFEDLRGTEPPPPPQYANTYYVTASATGSGDGTQSNPWTFNQAVSTAAPDSLVLVSPGTYGNVLIQNKTANLAASPIVFRKNGTGAAIIRHASTSSGTALEIINSKYYVFDGITVQQGLWGVRIDNADHIIFRNGEVTGQGQEGFFIINASNNIDIIDSHIHHTGVLNEQWGECFYLGTSGVVDRVNTIWIEGNEINDCAKGEGIDIKSSVSKVTVKNNTLYNLKPGTATQFNDGSITTSNAPGDPRLDNWIEGNEIYNVSGGEHNHGIVFYGGGASIKNNNLHDIAERCLYGNAFENTGHLTYYYGNTFANCGENTFIASGLSVSTADPGTNPRTAQTWYSQ